MKNVISEQLIVLWITSTISPQKDYLYKWHDFHYQQNKCTHRLSLTVVIRFQESDVLASQTICQVTLKKQRETKWTSLCFGKQ